MKVILITGASSGIGYKAAIQLAKEGYKVYGGARRVERMQALTDFGITPLELDLTKPQSLKFAVDRIIEEEGHIDILVNNAGYGSYGAIENVDIEEAKRQFDVNIFGLARLVQLVLPHMRNQHSGRIINISSMAGRMTTFMGAWYHATKYALEAFSDALRMEIKPFGIDVVIVEPGGIKTDWGLIAADHLEESSQNSPYEEMGHATAKKLRREYTTGPLSKPDLIANTITKAVMSKRPRTRYLVGFGAKPVVFLHTVLPDRWFDAFVKKFV
ncbi:oxidoreductase [Pediococcus argentinicus]|nr:oxidoreductase [Pediococcus argentinicus]NKZ23060.1 oxidoreductase [Pediococcus argentinicus]GEP20134.1 short-chain dehydrogenase/reductase [Pediococcus argentinicus]